MSSLAVKPRTQLDAPVQQTAAPTWARAVWAWVAKHPGLAIFAAALCIRVAWVLTLKPSLSWPDEEEFVGIARHLAHGDGFIAESYRATPIFPVYLGLMFSVFGESYLAARLGQAIFGALTCVLLYRTGSLLMGRRVGVLSGVLLALYPPHIFLSGMFYVECMLILFISLSIYLAARGLVERPTFTAAVLCGVSSGVTALTRPIFTNYVPFLCAAWIYSTWPAWRRQALVGAALLAAAAATIAPWAVRNYVVYGHAMTVSSGFYTNLWRGNNVLARGDAYDRVADLGTTYWTERLNQLDEPQRRAVEAQYAEVERVRRELQRQGQDWYLASDAAFKPVLIDYVRHNPGRVLVLFLKKLVTLYSAFTPTYSNNDFTSKRNQLLAVVTFYPLLLLALAGAWVGLREPRALSIVYLFIFSISCTYAAHTACTRFRLPLDPYLIMFAALALARMIPHPRSPSPSSGRGGR